MFQKNDYVMKANTGLCQIKDVVHLDGMDIDKKKLYYLLIPATDDKAKIYVPVDPEPVSMRKTMDGQKAWELIQMIPGIEEVTIKNEKIREQEYKEAIRSGNPKRWISIIKTMYLRRKKRVETGKKQTAMDEHYFKIAEDYLYSELAFAIGKNKSEMKQIIADTVKNDMNANTLI